METSTKPRISHECPHCSRSFTRVGHLNRHIRTHTNERPYKCTHSTCDKQFTRPESLRRHELSHLSPEELQFKCTHDKCGKSFSTKQRLDRHEELHKQTKQYHCSLCSESFSKKRLLGDHNATKHSHEKPYICSHSDCEASFLRPSGLQRHILQVHTEKTYVCMDDDCKHLPPFTKFSDLQRHLRKEHKPKNQNICTTCDKLFRSKSSLQKHQKNHEIPVMDREQFQCNFPGCDATYTSSSNLGTHIRSKHTKVNCFVCDICESTFSLKSSLKRHMIRVHALFDDSLSGQDLKATENLVSNDSQNHLIQNYSNPDDNQNNNLTKESDSPDSDSSDSSSDKNPKQAQQDSNGSATPASFQTTEPACSTKTQGSDEGNVSRDNDQLLKDEENAPQKQSISKNPNQPRIQAPQPENEKLKATQTRSPPDQIKHNNEPNAHRKRPISEEESEIQSTPPETECSSKKPRLLPEMKVNKVASA